ncbi:MAG: putative DNA binding domain-containing protein [Pseudomonadales bacterium]|nr:putative DNA binding domain-containing protein [Pseudomonadales bacterium]
MLKSELLEIIANGETSGVEFKRDDVRPEQLAKEVVAMANLKGGMLLLGVEDDGTISGVKKDKLEEWVMDGVFGAKVHPMMLPFYEEVKIEADCRVAVISFTQGTSKPYVVRDKGREDVYVRVGTTSRLASREQQARLFESGGILHSEVLPVAGTSFVSLSQERLSDYLSHIINDPDVPANETEWIQRLIGLSYMAEGVADKPVCTIAGLVLFGHSPRKSLHQAGIRLMVFDSVDKQYEALLDEILDSPMVGLWRTDEEGQRQLADSDVGIIERFIDKVTPFISDESDEVDEGFRREKQWHYPRDAVRELIINALVHRDWTQSIDIEICVYSNRMEVVSPGTLHNSMTIEKMLAGQRSPRNPLIVELLRDYGYVDARGMGVRTKIIPLMKTFNQSEPEFELTDDYLKTTLYKKI